MSQDGKYVICVCFYLLTYSLFFAADFLLCLLRTLVEEGSGPQCVNKPIERHFSRWYDSDRPTTKDPYKTPQFTSGSEAHVDRLEEVTKESEASGTYYYISQIQTTVSWKSVLQSQLWQWLSKTAERPHTHLTAVKSSKVNAEVAAGGSTMSFLAFS